MRDDIRLNAFPSNNSNMEEYRDTFVLEYNFKDYLMFAHEVNRLLLVMSAIVFIRDTIVYLILSNCFR